MKLKVVFEVRQCEELEDCWGFNGVSRESKIILVEEDISFVGFIDKIYSKLGLGIDMFQMSLSYFLQLIGKSSLIFIRIDEDVKLLLEERNEKICKIPLNVTLIPKGVTINDDSDDDSDDDEVDFSSHDGGLHDTLFDVDFMENDQSDVGTSRTKFPVHRNVETVGVEFGRRGSGS